MIFTLNPLHHAVRTSPRIALLGATLLLGCLSSSQGQNLRQPPPSAAHASPEHALIKLTPDDPQQLFDLALRYHEGRGVARDEFAASQTASRAASKGIMPAETWLVSRVDAGDPFAALWLAHLYEERNEGKAERVAELYRSAHDKLNRAANAGDLQAMYALGYASYYGMGVAQNLSAEEPWMLRAAQGGLAAAQFKLAKRYDVGNSEVPRDAPAAVSWYEKAAAQGHAAAQNNLGLMYGDGRGASVDLSRAVTLLGAAAEQGDGTAQFNLGGYYERGKGVPANLQRARAWYELSAAQGDLDAENKLKQLGGYTSPAPTVNSAPPVQSVSDEVSLQEDRAAAERGDAQAQNRLGVVYLNGKLVPKDGAQAERWLRLSAEQGYKPAALNLSLMYALGNGVPRNTELFEEWSRRAAAMSETIPAAPATAPQGSPEPPAVPSAAPADAQPSAEELALARALKVEQPDGYFATAALQTFLVGKLSQKTLEHLAKSNHAIYVSTTMMQVGSGELYCIASAGVTEAQPADRNPRFPARIYAGLQRVAADGDHSDDGVRLCRVNALTHALSDMTSDALELILDRVERTSAKGAKLPPEKPNDAQAHLTTRGLSEAAQREILHEVSPEARRAFDHRRLEWVVRTLSFELNGRRICFASAGVTARSPSNRQARVPARSWERLRALTPEASSPTDAEEQCLTYVSTMAVKDALQESWDKDGLLAGFERTREDGIPLLRGPATPKAATRLPQTSASVPQAAAKVGPQRGPPRGACQPPTGKVLRYSDRCTNGDCTRTFENGCSVRFQAAYCYDALSSSWQWKTDGC